MKKTLKILVAVAMLFGIGLSSLAAEGLENRNAIGVYVIGSETPFGGIQYERRVTDLISFKVNTYIYYDGGENASNPLDYNIIGECDFTLYETDWFENSGSRLFAYVLAGHTGSTSKEYVYDSVNGTGGYTNPVFTPNAVVSAGFGFDFIFFKHLSIPCQFGFIGNFPNDASAGFCAGTGLRYSW